MQMEDHSREANTSTLRQEQLLRKSFQNPLKLAGGVATMTTNRMLVPHHQVQSSDKANKYLRSRKLIFGSVFLIIGGIAILRSDAV